MTAMAESRTLGPRTVLALQDAEGPFFDTREAAFPDATAAQWAAADAFDPAARTADGGWWLRFRTFAIRYAEGPVTLVDAGIGPADAPAKSCAPVPGRLPDELVSAGDERLLVTGDLLVHAVQLLYPELAYAHDMDFSQARASRVEAFGRGDELAVSHLGAPWLAALAIS